MGVIKSIYNGAKNFINGIKNTIKKIGNAVKFFISPIGGVVGWILLGIFIMILLFAIGKTGARALRNLFGEDWNYSTYSGDLEVIEQLYNSGYEAVISAENFQDFKAFEYAVLMDAAEYLRAHQGELSVIPVGCQTNQSNLPDDQLDQYVLDGARGARSVDIPDGLIPGDNGGDNNNTRAAKPLLVYEFKLSTMDQDYAFDPIESGEKSGDKDNTTEALIEEGKLKGSLEPYIYIIRDDVVFSYFFYNQGAQPKVVEYSMPLNAYNATLMFGREMSNQISEWSGGESIELEPDKGSYPPVVPYYTDVTKNIVYKIPLRTLIGRYMPRAELLQAWAILKQDIDEPDKDKDDIVDELLASIKGVYNEACLDGENFKKVEKTNESGDKYYYSNASTHNNTFVSFATAGIESTDYGLGDGESGFTKMDGSENTDVTIVRDFISAVSFSGDFSVTVSIESENKDYDPNDPDSKPWFRDYFTTTLSLDKVSGLTFGAVLPAGEPTSSGMYSPPTAVESTEERYYKKSKDEAAVKGEIEDAVSSYYKSKYGDKFKGASINNYSSVAKYEPIFTTEKVNITNKLNINHTRMSVLLIDSVTTWARKINYTFNITQNKFKPDDKKYIIPCCVDSMGLEIFNISLTKDETYRGMAYRDIFARMKEKDVINTLLQLEQGGIEGTADCYEYMRDVYKLLETAKEYSLKNPDSSNSLNNIHENTYSYVYIPDTVLKYNDTQTQTIYWLNLFEAENGVDAISKEEVETMKTKDNEITWQVIEYEKYPECNENGNVKVYALSPFGSVYARSFYQNVYESTTKNSDHSNLHEYIQGDFGGSHTGCDWGGRRSIKRVLSGASADDNDPYGKEIYDYELGRLSNIYGEDKAKKMIKDEIQEHLVNNPLVAIAPGRVQTVAYQSRAGFYVKIAHSLESGDSAGMTSDYLHMKRWPLVNVGDYVGAGTLLGYEGNTGRSYGSHVHFEIKDGRPPYDYIFPGFNPFYNSGEAYDEGYELCSEYMSLYRTGSMVDIDSGIPVKIKTGEELVNQHPKNALLENYNDLINSPGKIDRKVVIAGDLGWNSTYGNSKEYIKYLQNKEIYDVGTKEAFFNKKLAQEQGYLDIPPELLLAIYGSMCVNTTMPGSLPPLTENELKYILNNWLPSRYNEKEVAWLMKNVFTDSTIKAIIEAEEQYHVSPVFALAVATLEQQLGLSYVRNNDHILGKPGIYNIFSIKGTKGGGVEYQSPGTMWNVYNSYGHAFQEFSALIAEGKYYFTQGKYTIAEIGATYCPPGDSWTSQVSSIVMEIMQYYTGNWSSLPLQIIFNVGSNADLVEAMKNCMDYLNLHKNTFKYGYSVSVPPYSNNSTSTQWGSPRCSEMDCSAYVSWVIYEVAKANNCQGLLNEFGRWSSYDFDDLGNDLSMGKTTGVCKYFQLVCARKDIPKGEISKVKDKLQAGDIIVYHEGSGHHVEFVKETGKTNVYSAGDESHWKKPGAQSYTRRSDVTWIIRLKSTL